MRYGMGQCAGCSADQAEPRFKLWDGNYYCVPCLDGAAEGLASYAEAHAIFEETMPESVDRQLPTVVDIVFRVGLFRIVLLCSLAWLILSGPLTWMVAVASLAVAVFEAGFAVFIVWTKGPFRSRRVVRGIRIEDGIVSVLEDGHPIGQFPLESARCLRSFDPIECIVLVDTIGKDSLRQVFKRVALAGFTDHTRVLIEGLFRIKGIELHPPPEEGIGL
jgi:hypothetical protein